MVGCFVCFVLKRKEKREMMNCASKMKNFLGEKVLPIFKENEKSHQNYFYRHLFEKSASIVIFNLAANEVWKDHQIDKMLEKKEKRRNYTSQISADDSDTNDSAELTNEVKKAMMGCKGFMVMSLIYYSREVGQKLQKITILSYIINEMNKIIQEEGVRKWKRILGKLYPLSIEDIQDCIDWMVGILGGDEYGYRGECGFYGYCTANEMYRIYKGKIEFCENKNFLLDIHEEKQTMK